MTAPQVRVTACPAVMLVLEALKDAMTGAPGHGPGVFVAVAVRVRVAEADGGAEVAAARTLMTTRTVSPKKAPPGAFKRHCPVCEPAAEDAVMGT